MKKFFKQILKIDNKEAKNEVCDQIKEFYDNNDFEENDIYDIAKDTDKEYELFKYANIDYNYSNDDIEL